MGCGREAGGARSEDLGVCPAAADESFDGLNLGRNAGRICWAVAGTFCGGRVQGTFAEKRRSCVDCEFFRRVQQEQGTADLSAGFLKFVSPDTVSPILKNLTYQHIRAGTRFIRQGEPTDKAYIIERGSCLVIVEKEDGLHPVRHGGPGDIVGELTIITGEPQPAHAEAQTDMDVWVLDKAQFADLSAKEPKVLEFLTELVADRFDSRRPIADRTIGKYVATDVIGSGGYSIVYRGYHRTLNRPVAIKMLRHDLALRPEFQRSFWGEARTVAHLDHENIIRVFDIEELHRTVFIIMELLEGESLQAMIRRLGSIPAGTAARILAQLCAGLAYAHAQGILHQDVNPSNVHVLPGDRVKILDFGVACSSGCDDRSIFDGTIYYMAPEQIRCQPVDPRSDIFSLGITAFEMVTGRRPFPEQSIARVMDLHVSADIPDPGQVKPGVPEPLRRFIRKACRRDPQSRYRTAGEAAAELGVLTDAAAAAAELRSSPDPIDLLIREHALIRQFLDNLALAAERIETGEPPPSAFFETAIAFARDFADGFHHFKEEHLMFTQLAQKKGGLLDGQLEALRHQHERGRNFVRGMAEALEGYARGDETHLTALLENLAAYVHLLRHHIHREDHLFFEMARQEFSAGELSALGELFLQEERREEGMSFEQGQGQVQEMAKRL